MAVACCLTQPKMLTISMCSALQLWEENNRASCLLMFVVSVFFFLTLPGQRITQLHIVFPHAKSLQNFLWRSARTIDGSQTVDATDDRRSRGVVSGKGGNLEMLMLVLIKAKFSPNQRKKKLRFGWWTFSRLWCSWIECRHRDKYVNNVRKMCSSKHQWTQCDRVSVCESLFLEWP